MGSLWVGGFWRGAYVHQSISTNNMHVLRLEKYITIYKPTEWIYTVKLMYLPNKGKEGRSV